MRRISSVGLTAGILGFSMCPLFYAAIAVPRGFPLVAAVALIVISLASSGFLLVRSLASPSGSIELHVSKVELVATLAAAGCIVVANQAVFIEASRRVAFAVTVFSVAWTLCLPIPLLRNTALEWRVSRLPAWIAFAVLLVLLSTSAFGLYQFLSLPRHLI